MSLEKFKKFIKEKPYLINYVNKKEKTWQELYEIYELYGEDSDIWKDYKEQPKQIQKDIKLKDIFNMFGEIDINKFQETIDSLQKGIGYLENIVKEKENKTIPKRSTYEKRPMYKYFDD